MLAFNVYRWNPNKRPAKNLSCHIGVLAKAQYDMFRVLPCQTKYCSRCSNLIKSIQVDGPTYVLRRQTFELTAQVTNLNL